MLYPSNENNVALQPVLAAVLLYVQIGKNVVIGINDSFGDMYGGKTITLDATKDAMMLIYPKITHKVTDLYERILDHLQGVQTERKQYVETLHNVLRDFHDEPITLIEVMKPVTTQDEIPADAQ